MAIIHNILLFFVGIYGVIVSSDDIFAVVSSLFPCEIIARIPSVNDNKFYSFVKQTVQKKGARQKGEKTKKGGRFLTSMLKVFNSQGKLKANKDCHKG